MAARKNALKELQSRQAELVLKCKEKEEEIGRQTEYITGHFGEIAIKSIIGDHLKKGSQTEIINFLVAEGIETAVTIQKDPHDIKDKLLDALKKSASGVLNLLFK